MPRRGLEALGPIEALVYDESGNIDGANVRLFGKNRAPEMKSRLDSLSVKKCKNNLNAFRKLMGLTCKVMLN